MKRLGVALLLWVPAVAAAQEVTPLTTLELGQPVTVNRGSTTQLYRFGAEAGTTMKAKFEGAGKAAVVLYTPAGEEMLSAVGDGTVTLEAILPLTDVFMIAVLREDASSPFTMRVDGDEPDPHFARFAVFVGYEFVNKATGNPFVYQCWVDAGNKLRHVYTDPQAVTRHIDVVLGRNGRTYTTFFLRNGGTSTQESLVTFEGEDEIETTSAPGRAPVVSRREAFNWSLDDSPSRIGRYVGYVCQ